MMNGAAGAAGSVGPTGLAGPTCEKHRLLWFRVSSRTVEHVKIGSSRTRDGGVRDFCVHHRDDCRERMPRTQAISRTQAINGIHTLVCNA